MMKKLLLATAAALLTSVGAAQVIAPTVDDHQTLDQNVAVDNVAGAPGARIMQDVRVNVPQIFALHLGASFLDFDLAAALNGDTTDSGLICVYGDRTGTFDDFGQINGALPGDTNTWISGTRYEYANGGQWSEGTEPEIRVIRWDGSTRVPATPVTQWPLVEFDQNGGLADKDGSVVCYRAFVMQKYTNDTNGWELSVDLDAEIPGVNLYIQDNTRCTFNGVFTTAGERGFPFVELTEAGPVSLMSDDATTWGFDGNSEPVSCDRADYAGWLDDLVVVAAEIGMETPALDQERTLTYTLFPLPQ